jgi:hypothetical protein
MLPRALCGLALLTLGCAHLEQLRAFVQPPRFEQAPDRDPEIRLIGPRSDLPLGGAGVRLWTTVTNPNAFGLTLGTLKGTLFLEGIHAANADFPLGLPLRAGEDSTIPIDLSVSFADLPGLADVIRRAASRQPLAYRLDGTIGVDAGALGQPVFGPMTFLSGNVSRRLPEQARSTAKPTKSPSRPIAEPRSQRSWPAVEVGKQTPAMIPG